MRKVANAELVPRSGADAVINLIMWFIGLWNCSVGGMCKSLEWQMRRAPDSCRQSLKDHSSRSLGMRMLRKMWIVKAWLMQFQR